MDYNSFQQYPLNYLIQYILREQSSFGTNINILKLTNYRIIGLISLSLFSDSKRYKLSFDSIYNKKCYHYVTVDCLNADFSNKTHYRIDEKTLLQYIIDLSDAFIISGENNNLLSINFCVSGIWKNNSRR